MYPTSILYHKNYKEVQLAKRRKLPNGIGSITKIEKTTAGKKRLSPYQVRLPAYYDIEGKAVRKVLGYYKTYKEAYQALISYNGLDKKSDKLIDVFNAYKKSKDFKDLSKKSQRKYNTSFSHFEHLQTRKIADITRYQLQQVIDERVNEGYDTVVKGKPVHKEYSKSTIRQLKTTMIKIFDFALLNDIIDINIAKDLKVKGVINNTKKDKKIFNDGEINRLFTLREQIPFLNHILVMCFTGLRTGEYLSLTTDNINLDKNIISDFGKKTEKGIGRKVFILPNIKPILTDLIKQSQTGYIYEKNGRTVSENIFYQEYYKALEDANIEQRIPYSCRYTFATRAYEMGVNKKAIEDLMGHTTFKITDENYIINQDEFIESEMQKMI